VDFCRHRLWRRHGTVFSELGRASKQPDVFFFAKLLVSMLFLGLYILGEAAKLQHTPQCVLSSKQRNAPWVRRKATGNIPGPDETKGAIKQQGGTTAHWEHSPAEKTNTTTPQRCK
jgi:hypothetical protein